MRVKRDFGPDRFNEIPPHGRWQHFEVGGIPRVSQLIGEWENQNCDKLEITRRLIDLFLVSVLLDAGAGDTWRYVEPTTGGKYERSEGIAVASLYMFKAGAFSEDKEQPECVQGTVNPHLQVCQVAGLISTCRQRTLQVKRGKL